MFVKPRPSDMLTQRRMISLFDGVAFFQLPFGDFAKQRDGVLLAFEHVYDLLAPSADTTPGADQRCLAEQCRLDRECVVARHVFGDVYTLKAEAGLLLAHDLKHDSARSPRPTTNLNRLAPIDSRV